MADRKTDEVEDGECPEEDVGALTLAVARVAGPAAGRAVERVEDKAAQDRG